VPDREVFRRRPEFVAEFGNPAEIILRRAGDYDADLILLGARPVFGRLASVTHLGHSITHRVVVGANCPVLTLRS